MKDGFYSFKKILSFSRYSNFCISIFPSFSFCQPLVEDKSQSLWRHQLSKYKLNNTFCLSIDRVLNKQHFSWKFMQKMCTKASLRPLSIMVNNAKQPTHAKNFFKNKIHDFINYSTSICPFKYGNCGKKGKNWISREQKELFW